MSDLIQHENELERQFFNKKHEKISLIFRHTDEQAKHTDINLSLYPHTKQ